MLPRLAVIAILIASAAAQTAPPAPAPSTPDANPPISVLKTATHHAMQYYFSLPEGWTKDKKWPIVVAVSGSGKNFQGHAETFIAARKQMPFIIVSPVVLTNGGNIDTWPTNPKYNYAPSVWDEVDKTGQCEFDLKGV